MVVGYGDGALGVLSTEGDRLFEVPLGAHPEPFQLDAAGQKAYVNLPDSHSVAVVDLAKRIVAATWKLMEGDNYPMALDESNHRLFVVTRKPSRLLVYDTETGKQIGSLEADGDSDDVFYDAARKRIYASFGEGTLLVFEQRDADHYQLLTRIKTATGARTAFFSPELGQFFVAVPHRVNPMAEILVFQVGP